MTNLNTVVIEGRLCRDASEGVRMSNNSDTVYGTFSIAVTKSKKQNGQWVDETSYFDVKGFGKRYESAVPHMTKGSLVKIVGTLSQERWEKDGQKISRVVINAEQFFPTYKKQEGNSQGSTPQFEPKTETTEPQVFPEDNNFPF